jgi:tryptophan synthase beta chain
MSETVKYLLDENRLPKEWYNIVADLPRLPDPVLHPGTLKLIGPQDLEPLFPMALIAQEVATERTIEIPEQVRNIYRQWRSSAHRLERALDTPAKIYYKYEGVSPAGSHKPNTAVAQAFYNKEAGVRSGGIHEPSNQEVVCPHENIVPRALRKQTISTSGARMDAKS